MTVLGIGMQHDAGAAVVRDGRILSAVNEERLNRQKLFWGWPVQAIPEALRLAGVGTGDVEAVAVANTTCSTYTAGLENFYPEDWKRRMVIRLSRLGLAAAVGGNRPGVELYRLLNSRRLRFLETLRFERLVRGLGITAPIVYVDHHRAHLASAYYTSGWPDCLGISLDGVGDGYCSRIAVCRQGRMQDVHRIPFYHTPGQYYGFVTGWAGFTPGKHEGKITGLAAYGDPEPVLPVFQERLSYSEKRFGFVNHGMWGGAEYEHLSRLLEGHRQEDVAAAVQHHLEDVVVRYVRQAVATFGASRLALSGGIFANVKLNQRVREIEGVAGVYIHPHMGDGGLGVGAALLHCANQAALLPIRLDNVYLGGGLCPSEVQTALRRSGLAYRRHECVEEAVAEHLAAGRVVARVNGGMEYGPRALGNRSILYQATDVTVNDWLNRRLKRTEFMPFAPAILAEDAADYYVGYPASAYASEFMTITYDATPRCRQEAPATVHVDGTARPQTVSEATNPSFYRILRAYKARTGLSQVVNTSFNMHEEPIVRTADEAVRAFKAGHLDVLAIDDFTAWRPDRHQAGPAVGLAAQPSERP